MARRHTARVEEATWYRYPHCEAPDRFRQVLLEFIDSTAPARVSERQWRHLFEPPGEEIALEKASLPKAGRPVE